jgi:hypothetical protein
LASGAPPTSFSRPRGLPRRTLPRNRSLAIFPRGVRSSPELFEFRLRPPRPFAGTAPSRRNRSVPGHVGLPLVRFLLPRTLLRRVPLLRHALPCGRTCGTRIARPSPVPSSGFLPLSTVSAGSRLARDLLDPAVRRGPRRFAAFFHAARVPGAPLQSFPFPGSRTRSRGPPASLRVRSPTVAGATPAGSSRPLSRLAPALCRSSPPEGGPGTHEPGLTFPAIVSPVASAHPEVHRTYRPHPTCVGLAGKRPARPLRSLAPPGSPFSDDPIRLASLEPPVGALLGFFPFRALSTTVRGPVSRADTRGGVKPLLTCTTGRPAVALALRNLDSDAWTRESRIRRYARSREPRASPSGGDPAHQAPLERFRAPVTSPAPGPAGPRRTERLARAPSSAAPRASLPFTTRNPRRGDEPLDLEDARLSNRTPDPTPCEAGWRPNPSRSSAWSPVAG